MGQGLWPGTLHLEPRSVACRIGGEMCASQLAQYKHTFISLSLQAFDLLHNSS